MHPEIENLIEMAFADGIVTEKERAIILRKAEALGEDIDEVEMTLDARLHLMQKAATPPPLNVRPEKPKSNKHGGIKKCPSCGAVVKSMEIICSDCELEFTNTNTSSAVNKLMHKIEAVNFDKYDDEDDYYGKIATIIKACVIPSAADDIYEFGTKAVSEIDDTLTHWKEDSSAWKNKAEDCIIKLKIIEIKNPSYGSLRSELEKHLNEKKTKISANSRNDWFFIIAVIIFIFLGSLAYKYLF